MLRRDTIIALRTFVQSASSLTALTTSINNIKSNIIIGSYCDCRSHLYISDHQISPLHTTLCNRAFYQMLSKIQSGNGRLILAFIHMYMLNTYLPSICGSFFISAFPCIRVLTRALRGEDRPGWPGVRGLGHSVVCWQSQGRDVTRAQRGDTHGDMITVITM